MLLKFLKVILIVVVILKVVVLRKDMDHGKMLYSADGYVTAWFMWYLKGDTEAAKVFTGAAPELLTNPLYQNQQISITE